MTENDQAELDALNKAVDDAICTRREWLDKKMHEYSKLKVGDDIYDLNKGIKVGVVSKLYRYWTGKDDLRDDSLDTNYEYDTGCGHSNTSCQHTTSFGTRPDAIRRAELNLIGILLQGGQR